MSKISRRSILAADATGGVIVTTAAAQAAGIFGNPDLPPLKAWLKRWPSSPSSPRTTPAKYRPKPRVRTCGTGAVPRSRRVP
jgi:hypothetical protein